MLHQIVSLAKEHSQRVMITIGLGFIVVAIYIFYREWDDMSQVLSDADLPTVGQVGLLTATSYVLVLTGFVYIHRLFNFTLPVRSLSLIGFVSLTINHLIPLASVGGYSMRVYFLNQRGYSVKDSVTVSVIHSYFHNFILFTLFPVFAAYVLFTHQVDAGISIILVISAIVSLAVVIAVSAVIFHKRSRVITFNLLDKVFHLLNFQTTDELHRLLDHFENAKKTLLTKAPKFAIMATIVVVEWVVSTLALGYCFRAFGYSVPLPHLFVGFILGTSIGLFSLLPSGLGVQEGTMVLAFRLLGVPFELAFLAPILYRIIYYLLPAAISLVLYWLLLKNEKPEESFDILGNQP